MNTASRLISYADLKPTTGISYSRDHLRRLVKAGSFPKPVNLSSARIAWREADIQEWISARAPQSTVSE